VYTARRKTLRLRSIPVSPGIRTLVQMVPYIPLSMHFINLDLCFQALQAALDDRELLP